MNIVIERKELKISVRDLEIGMNVVKLDRPWIETNFLLQGFVIQDQQEIDAFMEQCEFVYIELLVSEEADYTLDRRNIKMGLATRGQRIRPTIEHSIENTNASSYKNNKKVSYINKIPVQKEMAVAKTSYEFARTTVKGIMDGIRIGRLIEIKEAKEVVNSIVDSILRNNDALMWLTRLKEKDEYTAEHSINVCILSVTFARHLGLEEDEIRRIGLSGFLHDVGKAKIPIEVLAKPGRFTDEEYNIMKDHPLFGRDLLMGLQETEQFTIDVAYSHHERIDGSGYPRGLHSYQISYYSLIVSIVDTYDAITSQRCYDMGRSSMDALDIIYKCRGTQFDENLAIEFIKCIGIYPPGAIVEMTNGEVGLILANNDGNKLKPKVILVLDADKKNTKERVVDLKNSVCDEQGKVYKISKELPNGKYGVDIKDYIKKGLII